MTWGTLFRHETLSLEDAVVQMAVKYLRACMTNFVKVRVISRPPVQGTWQTSTSPECLFISPFRLDFLPKTTAPAVRTRALTLTMTLTSTASLIVSLINLQGPAWPFELLTVFWFCGGFGSFSSSAGRAGEGRVPHSSSGSFPDSSWMVTVSGHHSHRHRREQMWVF